MTPSNFCARKGLGNNDAIDFDAMWAVLASSLREIHTKNASKLSFEELYRNAYKLVLKKKGETLYNKVKEFEEDWLANTVRPRILEEISPSIIVGSSGVPSTTTANEKRVAGERLLKALKEAWDDHNLCMNMTTDVLMYMVSLGHHSSQIGIRNLPGQCADFVVCRIASTARITESRRFLLRQWVNFEILSFGRPSQSENF